MRIISKEKTHKKWAKALLALSCFQLVTALALLIPALLSAKSIYDMASDYKENVLPELDEAIFNKAWKIVGEIAMFILFELWKLWLTFDGVFKLNTRTVWASTFFTLFSFGFSILMIVESVNWERSIKEITLIDGLKDIEQLRLISRNLLISLSCFLLVMIIPIFYITSKVAKDFGWDVYKKIGSSITIQKMYITVQWFSLGLKIDIFFEIFAYTLYLSYPTGNLAEDIAKKSNFTFFAMLLTVILIVPFFILSRYAISMENKIMMILFIVFQLWLTICTIIIMTKSTFMLKDWYAFTAYCIGCLASSIGTIILAIRCLLNFDKGLKDFVHWRLFGKKTLRRQSTVYDNVFQTDTSQELKRDKRVDIPIDD
ncbi:hypothetical protein BD770DRAFT_475783 [Pilaira anomala]|nr:hypothetical protein BD770DRAFT_475783 [Pilaira anomala]